MNCYVELILPNSSFKYLQKSRKHDFKITYYLLMMELYL